MEGKRLEHKADHCIVVSTSVFGDGALLGFCYSEAIKPIASTRSVGFRSPPAHVMDAANWPITILIAYHSR